MKHFLRLSSYAIAGGALLGLTAHTGNAQIAGILDRTPLSFLHASSQGYLGAGLQDIDKDRAASLKLKDVRGAEIVYVDHDAPANQAGLRVHDVVLQMNGQQVEGVEQLRRMLRETPSGRTITLLISRDGQTMSINVQLADRNAIARSAWDNHFSVKPPDDGVPGDFLGASPRGPAHQGFLGTIGPSSIYVGAEINPLTRQMADFLGVTEGQGLLVESVDDNSPAATAGLKAGDVITKINKTGVISRKDWLHELNSNKGKQVELTIVRNRKEQTLSMVAGDPKKKG
jgi:serine protease Do